MNIFKLFVWDFVYAYIYQNGVIFSLLKKHIDKAVVFEDELSYLEKMGIESINMVGRKNRGFVPFYRNNFESCDWSP